MTNIDNADNDDNDDNDDNNDNAYTIYSICLNVMRQNSKQACVVGYGDKTFNEVGEGKIKPCQANTCIPPAVSLDDGFLSMLVSRLSRMDVLFP